MPTFTGTRPIVQTLVARSPRSFVAHKYSLNGSKLQAEILATGLPERDLPIGSILIQLYAKCRFFGTAQQAFHRLPARDVISWNVIIAGYAEHGQADRAINHFIAMQSKGVSPNAATYVCTLKACGRAKALGKGQELHAQIIAQGLLEENLIVGNALIDMYARCNGVLEKAQDVLKGLPIRDTISWNALLTGCVQQERVVEALHHFEEMQHEGVSPDSITYVCMLKACAGIRAMNRGRVLHIEIARKGLAQGNLLVATSLIDMYAKCGELSTGDEVFDELAFHDVVSWNARITGYAQHGCDTESLEFFGRMQCEGLPPNAVSYVCILQSCGNLGASDKGEQIHAMTHPKNCDEYNDLLGSSLVDMYAKCGMVANAHETFEKLHAQNVVCWTAIMAGYAQLGDDDTVLDLFNEMIGDCIEPNVLTFTVVLNSCRHSGLIDKGQAYFEVMSVYFGCMPTLEHYSCMIDLFGRAGQFDNVLGMINKIPNSDYFPLWTALLGACQAWGNIELGRVAFEQATQLNKTDAAVYICMSNMYAAAKMEDEVEETDVMQSNASTSPLN